MEASSSGFGIRQPSLIQQLKTILDQYPDDGQILKELIQNAEDAGASKVKFLCDYNSYGTEKLHHQELDKFQGPALYAYNDEIFTDDDWEGIQKLCVSIKAKDPMKVGRFGLGFKSVYHMTDLPSIVSGTHVGIFDPHKTYFSSHEGERTTGHRWCFNQDREKVKLIPDQFAPYEGIFDCGKDCISNYYRGTLFRFPLRESSSDLSDNLYSPDILCERFKSFEMDAHMALLFLNNLESIEFYVREKGESSPRKTFEVKINEGSLEYVRAKRKAFSKQTEHLKKGEVPSSPVSETYPITIECTSYEGHESCGLHVYVLTNYISGGEVVSAEVKTLSEDLSYSPRVGVAISLEQTRTAEDPKGHLFCFLPLPLQKKSLTGLPVHVNGFFALSQNRRHLKWPTTDQEEGGKELTDKALQWNKFLVNQVVPRAYADLLLQSKLEVPLEVFYNAWPDPGKTDPKWQEMLPALFRKLLHQKAFHTTANGGEWLKIKDAIFDTLDRGDPETRKVILEALKSAKVGVVSAPCHVMDVIAEHCDEVAMITPQRVREILRQTPSCFDSFQRSEKLLLLKYLLQDSCFGELHNLELLPLSNGKFAIFLHQGHPPIYISSKEHNQSLLPGLDHLFVDGNVEERILIQIKEAAECGQLQLKHLDEKGVITLLPESFPDDWSDSGHVTWHLANSVEGHPPNEWLESVWKYLYEHFPHDLSEFENLPLIPVSSSGDTVTLARLHSPSAIVAQSSPHPPHDRLDSTVVKVLKNLGITVVSEFPDYVMSHPDILKYIHQPLVSPVLQAIVTQFAGDYEEVGERLQSQSDEYKRALRGFIAKAPGFTPEEQELVKHLPLFETLKASRARASRFVESRKICRAAPQKALPVNVTQELIDVSHHDSETLARLSGVAMLKTTELLDQIVFPDVEEGRYSEDDIDELMKHVFNHYSEYKEEMPEFPNTLKDLRFVPKKEGERVKPSDLFDPTVPSLQKVLAGEDVFPCGETYTQLGALGILRELGLKRQNEDLTACDVLNSVCHTEKTAEEGKVDNVQEKALALLEYMNDKIKMMQDVVDEKTKETLGTVLQRHSWVPTMTAARPPSYPEKLPFCILNDAHLLKPTEVTSPKFLYVIGTVKAVARIEENRLANVADFFEWTKVPDTEDVLKHLSKVVERYNQSEKETYMGIIKKIYQHLNDHPSKLTQALSKQKWIWNGDGFSSPDTMVFEKPFTDLAPYICPLPSEVEKFKAVFIAGGMREESKKLLLLRVLELIKEKYDKKQNPKSTDVKHDLQLSNVILNELKPSPGDCLEKEVDERLLIPTDVVNDSTLRLASIGECTYCDKEWLQQGRDTSDVDEEGDEILYVHRDISNDTAKSLGVPSLMSRIVNADELDIGEEFGQEEPLTRSINRLLEGYTDGFAVPKELIQNADDAGATEVKFLYDERTNEDCMTCLLDEGMKACQGPALWAYNNAVFTNEDFQNITKLNGATKEGDTEKIGRFGSGFNAVYNLTDVPSFVSRNSIVIFDPHKTHLGKAIGNGKPGIRIDFRAQQQNKQKLRQLANQFKPYNGIFGCDLSPGARKEEYGGTLFRFPLRTKEQAFKSELKDLHYDDKEVRELLSKLVEGAESLLQFTQTVCRVSLYHLPKSSCGTPEPKKLFELTKSAAKCIRSVSLSFPFPLTIANLQKPEQEFAKQSSFLRASSHALKTIKCSKDFPRSSMVIDIEMKHTKEGADFFSLEGDKETTVSWLISSSMGTQSALALAKKDKTLVPTAGVAVCLQRQAPEAFIPTPIDGKVYCYLPLPLHSGSPVHLNGFFAVASNRRHLKEKTEDDKHCLGDDWNEILMRDAVSEAYISALEDLKSLLPSHQGKCEIYKLWPRAEKVHSTCQPLVESFYSRLSAEGQSSPSLFSDGEKWTNIDGVVFLDPDLRNHHEIGDIAFQVFKALMKRESKMVVDLPLKIMESFRRCGYEGAIKKRMFGRKQFYQDIVLRNIDRIDPVQRDALVFYAVDQKDLRALLKDVPCIPVSPEGKELKLPGDLVHPWGEASALYSPEDGRFPHGTKDTFLNSACLATLTEELGMRKDHLGWEEIVDRAESVQTLSVISADHDGALKRTKALVQFLNKKTATENDVLNPRLHKNLREARFLPIRSKPKDFPLTWKGDDYGSHAVLAPKDVFQKKDKK